MSKSPVLSFLSGNNLLARFADGSINEQATGEALILALRSEVAAAADRYAQIEASLDAQFNALQAEGKVYKAIDDIAFDYAISIGKRPSEVKDDVSEFVKLSNRFESKVGRGCGVHRLAIK